MKRKRQNYLQASVRAEKAERVVLIEDDEDRLELAKTNASEMRNHALRASEDYFSSLAQEKQAWGDCDDYRVFCIESLKESEESRVQFIKKIFQKHLKMEKSVRNDLLVSLSNSFDTADAINPADEVKGFVTRFLNLPKVQREEWIDYDKWKMELKVNGQDPLLSEDGWISNKVAYVPMEPYLAHIKTVIYSLIPSKHSGNPKFLVSEREINDLLELLSNLNTWPAFFEAIDNRKHFSCIEEKNLEDLSRLLSKVLSMMQSEDPNNFQIFFKILLISHDIFSISEKGKTYLFKTLSIHPIFQNPFFWKRTIETAISDRVDCEKQIFKRNLENFKKQKIKSFNPGKFEEKQAEKNSALMLLSQFNFYMIHFQVDQSIALSIIHDCSKKAGVEPSKLSTIIIELHSLSRNYKFEKSSRSKSSRQGSKLRGRWGSFLYLGLAAKYLNRSEIRGLLTVSKTWFHVLRPWYLEKELLVHRNLKTRKVAWDLVLCRGRHKDYSKLVKNMKENRENIKQFEDVITMDVLRSYNNKGLVDLDSVKEILKVYAFCNVKVGYCQGMNYLAGTFFIVFKEKSKTYWAMDEFIRINSMFDLYSEELPKLKFLFFALDKLIALHLPDIFDTFSSETITSSSFSSPWFLTLFGALLLSNLDLQLSIWDLFIYVISNQRGWKVIFQVAITILSRLKSFLIWKKYEEIMCLLTGIQSSPHMTIFDRSFLTELQSYKITNRMLSQLRRDYDRLKYK
jgi:hypothetical protein